MPTIFNVGNSYNINNKKISSKITFESGERFSGRIIKKDDTNEVTIRLRDGWEFSAEIEGEISDFKGFQKFEVEGFEGGKLKLKLLYKNIGSDINNESSNLLLNNGSSESEIDLLKEMIKFNIPLNKGNIKELKSLINFLNKLNDDDNEIMDFIYKFIISKNLESDSIEGENIKSLLNDFLCEYKDLTKKDILFFFENNIDFNIENIKAYKNIFGGENKLFNSIDDLRDIINIDNSDENIDIKNNIEKLNIKDIEKGEINLESKFANNSYQKLVGNNKINILSFLKSISGYEEEYLNTALKDILLNNREKFKGVEFEKSFDIIEKIKPEEFINDIKEEINKNDIFNKKNALNFNKSDVENLLSKKLGRFIQLNDKDFIKIKDIINLTKEDVRIKNNINEGKEKTIIDDNLNNIIKNNNEIEVSNDNIVELSKEIEFENYIDNLIKEVKESIKEIGNNKKEILKEVINKINNLKDELLPGKIANFLKNNIDDIKLFNKLSLEYYYADIPININEKEYPCKIIIKDKRKDNKKIDGSNVKMIITIDTNNLGVIDGYINVLEKKLNINLKCEEKYIKIIEGSKEILTSNIKPLGFLVDVKINKKESEVSLANCREFFSEEFGLSLDTRV